MVGCGDAVQVPQELERVGEGKIPPEQRTLPEHDTDAARERDAVA